MHVPNKHISLLILPTPLEISLDLAKIRLDQLRIIHTKRQLRWTIRRQQSLAQNVNPLQTNVTLTIIQNDIELELAERAMEEYTESFTLAPHYE